MRGPLGAWTESNREGPCRGCNRPRIITSFIFKHEPTGVYLDSEPLSYSEHH